jgi:hypothetical protein
MQLKSPEEYAALAEDHALGKHPRDVNPGIGLMYAVLAVASAIKGTGPAGITGEAGE